MTTVGELKALIADLPDDLRLHLGTNNHTMSRGDDIHVMLMRYGYGSESTRDVLALWNYRPWSKHPCPNDPVLTRELVIRDV